MSHQASNMAHNTRLCVQNYVSSILVLGKVKLLHS